MTKKVQVYYNMQSGHQYIEIVDIPEDMRLEDFTNAIKLDADEICFSDSSGRYHRIKCSKIISVTVKSVSDRGLKTHNG